MRINIRQNNKGLHRENKPSHIVEKNHLYVERWFKDGIEHNENGPAIQWYSNGKLTSTHYFKNGKHHNESGSAFIQFWRCEGPTGYIDQVDRKMTETW